MNEIEDDQGQWVTAVGAPASLERVKVEWPKLIATIRGELANASAYGYPRPDFVSMCRAQGVISHMETNNVIAAALDGTPYAWDGVSLRNNPNYNP